MSLLESDNPPPPPPPTGPLPPGPPLLPLPNVSRFRRAASLGRCGEDAEVVNGGGWSDEDGMRLVLTSLETRFWECRTGCKPWAFHGGYYDCGPYRYEFRAEKKDSVLLR